jgi:hypothetical protein
VEGYRDDELQDQQDHGENAGGVHDRERVRNQSGIRNENPALGVMRQPNGRQEEMQGQNRYQSATEARPLPGTVYAGGPVAVRLLSLTGRPRCLAVVVGHKEVQHQQNDELEGDQREGENSSECQHHDSVRNHPYIRQVMNFALAAP